MRRTRAPRGRIRVRRLPSRFLRRRRYEVESKPEGSDAPAFHVVTSTPVQVIEGVLGTGDAWSVVKAADERWDGTTGEWVSLYAQPDD
jgi:hypothetical protein